MTKLSKPMVRETDVYERTRALIVELHPRYLSIRLKGTSEALIVAYDAILALARRQAARR